MSKNHLMLDIETLDIRPSAAVLSIAAMFFDPVHGTTGASFERQINLKSCVDLGLTVDPDTIMWWMGQSKEAQAAFRGNSQAQALSTVLCEFAKWVKFNRPESEPSLFVWGNGKDFDCVVLENAYRAAGITSLTPWKFWETMDVRTIVAIGGMVGTPNFKKEMEFEGTPHNAIDDVKHQIKYVSAYTKCLMEG